MRLRSLLLALAAVFAFGALYAASAVATEGNWESFSGTLTYTGSSTFTAKSAQTKLNDETNGNEFKCNESEVGGVAEPSGTTNAGDKPLMHIKLTHWNKGAETCEGPFGIKFAVTEGASNTKPWLVHGLWRLVNEKLHHFLGLILNIKAVLKGTECELETTGKVPVLILILLKTGQPFVDFRFGKEVNTSNVGVANTLTIKVLKESGIFGCGGTKTGDTAFFEGLYEETTGPEKVKLE